MKLKNFEIEFDNEGRLVEARQLADAISGVKAGSFTDLFVMSHGWNNDIKDARELYESFFGHVSDLLKSGAPDGLKDRSFAVVSLFWPSKRFADAELIPGGAASFDGETIDPAILGQLDALKTDQVRLGEDVVNPVRATLVDQAKALLPKLEDDPAAREKFVSLIRSVLNPAAAHADDGSDGFFTTDALVLLDKLSEPVDAPKDESGGGAAGFGDGVGQVFGDLTTGVQAAVRRLLNFSTYYTMKDRAGTVGRVGLAPALRQLRAQAPGVRLHLIGHSFGGRLVTAATHALGGEDRIDSLTLLQAAFSHNGLGRQFDGAHDGAFRTLIDRGRVTGPISITYTRNDNAVGVAYPLASRIAGDVAAALGDANDPYGGMGRNGAQHTPEAMGRFYILPAQDGALKLEKGKVHNFESSACISGHSDIANRPVAFLELSAVAKS